MAEVVHEHSSGDNGSGMGFFMGMVLLVIVLLLFFFYGLPILRNMTSNSVTNINVPDKVDVNVTQPAK